MKKMIFILMFSLGLGLSQGVSAACSETWTSFKINKQNDITQIRHRGHVIYSYTNPINRITTVAWYCSCEAYRKFRAFYGLYSELPLEQSEQTFKQFREMYVA